MMKRNQVFDHTDCPLCGAKLTADRLLVDLDTNTVCFRGKIVRVSPQKAVALFTLAKRWPRTVHYREFDQAIWGYTGAPSYRSAEIPAPLGNFISILRHKVLRLLGCDIKNEHGIGYRLDLTTRRKEPCRRADRVRPTTSEP